MPLFFVHFVYLRPAARGLHAAASHALFFSAACRAVFRRPVRPAAGLLVNVVLVAVGVRLHAHVITLRRTAAAHADANDFFAAHRFALEIENTVFAAFAGSHFQLGFAVFLFVFERTALGEAAVFEHRITVFLLGFAALAFKTLFHEHVTYIAERDAERGFALQFAVFRFRFALAADGVVGAVDDHDALDAVLLLRFVFKTVVEIVVIVVIVRARDAVVVQFVLQRIAVQIAVGYHHFRFVPFAVGCALLHLETAVAEQAFDQRHVRVQFGLDLLRIVRRARLFVSGIFTRARLFVSGIFRARLRLRSLRREGQSVAFGGCQSRGGTAVHRGDEHPRRRRAEPVHRFGRIQLVELAAGRTAAARAFACIRARRHAGGERQAEQQCQHCDDLFHRKSSLCAEPRPAFFNG